MDMKISNRKTNEILATVDIPDSVIDDGILIRYGRNRILMRETDGDLFVYGEIKGHLIHVKNK